MRKERVVLKYHTDAALFGGKHIRRAWNNAFIQMNFAVRRRSKARD